MFRNCCLLLGILVCVVSLDNSKSLMAQYFGNIPKYRPPRGPVSDRVFVSMDAETEQSIRGALNGRADFHFQNSKLEEVARHISNQFQLNVVVDRRALDEIGLTSDQVVNVSLSKVQLKSALDEMLSPLDLTWTIRSESLVVTTRDAVETSLHTAIYEVTDITSNPTKDGRHIWYDADTLIDLIISIIAPNSWDDVGGVGSVQSIVVNGRHFLVFSQTFQIHDQVAALLATQRKVSGLPAPESSNVSPSKVLTKLRRTRQRITPARRYTVGPSWSVPTTHLSMMGRDS